MLGVLLSFVFFAVFSVLLLLMFPFSCQRVWPLSGHRLAGSQKLIFHNKKRPKLKHSWCPFFFRFCPSSPPPPPLRWTAPPPDDSAGRLRRTAQNFALFVLSPVGNSPTPGQNQNLYIQLKPYLTLAKVGRSVSTVWRTC